MPAGELFATFGQYVLTPRIFELLRATRAEKKHFTECMDLKAACRCLDGVAGLAGQRLNRPHCVLTCTNPTSHGTSLNTAPQLYGRDGTGSISPAQFRAPWTIRERW